MPGASRTPLTRYAARAYASLSLAYLEWPDNGGTMPGEDHTFTTHVDPGSPPCRTGPCPSAGSANGGGAGYCPRVRNAYSMRRLSP